MKLVPARGFEPRTLGLKARPDLRRTPPQASPRTRFSASRLPLAPRGTPAWLYRLAICQPPQMTQGGSFRNANQILIRGSVIRLARNALGSFQLPCRRTGSRRVT